MSQGRGVAPGTWQGELLTVSDRQLTWGELPKMGSMDSSSWHEREADALGLRCLAQGTRTVSPDTTPFDSRGGVALTFPSLFPPVCTCKYPPVPVLTPVPRRAPVRPMGDKYSRTTRDLGSEYHSGQGAYLASYQCFRPFYLQFTSLSSLEPVR